MKSESSKSTKSRIKIKSSTMLWLLIMFLSSLCLQVNSHSLGSIDPYTDYHYDPYSYGYDVEDNYGNKQWRQEKSHNPHEVHGSYGYRDNNGIYREVVYVADKDGFRANIKTNEPGLKGGKDPSGVKLESYYPVHSHRYS